jgi:hypothetical protein
VSTQPRLPRCEYFTWDPELKVVVGCEREAADGPMFFFVPTGILDAVRVPVCEEHLAVLVEREAGGSVPVG